MRLFLSNYFDLLLLSHGDRWTNGHLATAESAVTTNIVDVLIVEKLLSVSQQQFNYNFFLTDFLAVKRFCWRKRQIMRNSLKYAPLAPITYKIMCAHNRTIQVSSVKTLAKNTKS